MKTRAILLLTLGLGVIASPVSKQTSQIDNKSTTESSESVANKKESIAVNKGAQEQKEDVSNETNKATKDSADANLNLVLEENIVNLSAEEFPEAFISDVDTADDFDLDIPVNVDEINVPMLPKPQDEIMETAAGFVPTPLVFRRRQKPKRKFATRRYNKKPQRKLHFFYPYYYGYYRPGSLGYYYN